MTITNTPDALTETVAEHTVALILSLGRRVVESDRFLREGKYKGWDPMLLLGMEFKNKTLGIVGCGRIGGRVAEIMHKGFGMKIAYYDRNQNDPLESELSATFMPELDDLLSSSDIVSLHLPATPETQHLLNEERLTKMKPTALLINTSRGSVVDEAALAKALKTDTITGAALDVFENEPDVHPELLALENVILTPHIASATLEAREQMSIIAADNIIAVLNNQSPPNPVI
ncbi:MAG: D-glycerate dehydrogenase [Candidatus Paceibacterota bacterium]